jgi:hypothetical protein
MKPIGYICGFCFTVMEIACGEHGECIPKLVMAVNGGKCNNLNQQQLMASVTETCIANDISKDSTNSKWQHRG